MLILNLVLFYAASFSLDTNLALINGVCFQGSWFGNFKPKSTEKKPFYIGSESEKIDVRMMSRTGNYCTGAIADLDARYLILPFKVSFKTSNSYLLV